MMKVLILFFFFSYSLIGFSQKQQPKLVIGIVVDQMRYDYLTRYWNRYGEGGFKKLINGGFNCKNVNYNYMPTYTGPGHASIFTGATPNSHGIIANDWYDKTTGTTIYCAGDNSVNTIGSSTLNGKMSPKNLISTTITDELKLATKNKGKVIHISSDSKFIHPKNIDRSSFKFGVTEIVNRSKIVNKYKLSKKLFFIGVFLRFTMSFCKCLLFNKKYFLRSMGNIYGIFILYKNI